LPQLLLPLPLLLLLLPLLLLLLLLPLLLLPAAAAGSPQGLQVGDGVGW
jgi:hypothetical protein